MNNMHRTQIRCFLCTTAEVIRHNSLCPVAAETIFFDNFRERIAGILAKYFRADIPARSALTHPPRSILTFIRLFRTRKIQIGRIGI